MSSNRRSQQGGVFGALRALDAFPKVNEDFFQKTMSGGIITMVAYSFMLLLFVSETRLYLSVHRAHELVVDSSRGETIKIDVDVTFPRMPCSWLSLDAMDVSGELHLDVEHDVYKQRLAPTGAPVSEAERHILAPGTAAPAVNGSSSNSSTAADACGTCYGAEDAEHRCCNTCDEVRSAYQRKGWVMLQLSDVTQCAHDSYLEAIGAQEGEGCRMWGRLDVNKVAGNFHFAAGRSYQQGSVHIHDMAPFADKALDFSHTINKLSFGSYYPGMVNPLDGARSSSFGPPPAPPAPHGHTGKLGAPEGKGTQSGAGTGGVKPRTGMYQYFVKVVPTLYIDIHNKSLASNQYSVTEHFRESGAAGGMTPSRTLPGLFVFYDLSPIKVHVVERHAPLFHYLTNLCAIIGGVFAISGLVDAAAYQGERLIRKKIQMGKFS